MQVTATSSKKDLLKRSLNRMAVEIQAVNAKRDRISSEARKLQLAYLREEEIFAKEIGDPIDNSKLIQLLTQEEAAYQQRLRNGDW
jgi:hypothetical protein